MALAASVGGAQQTESRSAPQEAYFLGFGPYYDGDYRNAGNVFRDAGKGGMRSISGRWIDSICYHTMVGECFYQMGDYPRALEQYEAALRLYLAHHDWMLRVQWPPAVDPAASTVRQRITWGPGARTSALGRFPDKLLTHMGQSDQANQQAVQQGGVVASQQLFPIVAQEVVRATAIAMQRRTELLGPVGPHDPLSAQLVEALARRPAPPNHWSQSWVSALLGLAYSSSGQTAQAVTELQRSLLVGGQFDHPLTGIALLELGRLAERQQETKVAATFYFEATLAAAQFGQAEVVEEAFRRAATLHLVTGQGGVYPPLAPAAAWARQAKFRQLHVVLLLLSAEQLAHAGDPQAAGALIDEARRSMGRNLLAQGLVGGEAQRLSALVQYQRGNAAAGDTALAAWLAFQRGASKRLFQMALADRLYTAGALSPRVAYELFGQVCREPTAADWRLEPAESLTVTLATPLAPLEHWFETALEQRLDDVALELTDVVRRRRFTSTLPLGGRLLALRWVLEAPAAALDNDTLVLRQDLLQRFPKYAELRRQHAALLEQLNALPPEGADRAAVQTRDDLLRQLEALATARELALREIALRREPANLVAPPLRSIAEVRAQLEPDQLALAFFATNRYVFAFLFTRDNSTHWRIESAPQVRTATIELLKSLGQHEANQPLTAKELADESWRESSAQLLSLLMNNAGDDFWPKYRELIVVPDGVLWYVPFEALCVRGSERLQPLIELVAVRYSPTIGWIVPDGRPEPPQPRVGVALGKLFPRDDDQPAQETYEQLRALVDHTVAWREAPAVGARIAAGQLQTLIVLDDVDDAARGPLAWSPLQLDAGKPGSTLGDWLGLPWGAPATLVMPGFHTPAENSLRRGGAGDDLFLAACALRAAGVRTAVLSRWRTGGRSASDLVVEFVHEAPAATAAEAWRRSVRLSWENELDPQREPRLAPAGLPPGVRPQHPFFWAGYLVVDDGRRPPSSSDLKPVAVDTDPPADP